MPSVSAAGGQAASVDPIDEGLRVPGGLVGHGHDQQPVTAAIAAQKEPVCGRPELSLQGLFRFGTLEFDPA